VRFAAKQKPHRPGIAPAPGLRAGGVALLLQPQTARRDGMKRYDSAVCLTLAVVALLAACGLALMWNGRLV